MAKISYSLNMGTQDWQVEEPRQRIPTNPRRLEQEMEILLWRTWIDGEFALVDVTYKGKSVCSIEKLLVKLKIEGESKTFTVKGKGFTGFTPWNVARWIRSMWPEATIIR